MTKMKECFEAYKQYKARRYDLQGAPLRNYSNLVSQLKPVEAFFTAVPTIPDQLKYQERRRGLGISMSTIAKELTLLRAALNYAKKIGLIDSFQGVEVPKTHNPRKMYLEKEQVFELFRKAEEDFPVWVFCVLAAHTLSRKTAIMELEWDRVDFDRMWIDFNTKFTPPNKRRVLIPMNKCSYAALNTARKKAKTRYVLEKDGKRYRDIQRGFKRAAEAAGVPWATPHILRHTGATLMLNDGVALEQIAGIMGDDIRTVMKTYAKFMPSYLSEALNNLSQLGI